MRFESITMNNYRPYEAYRLDFPKTKDTDLHVIIASNGVGKTTLLNAIEWCLYEDEPHLGDDNTLPICNMFALKRAATEGKDSECTSVKIDATEGSIKLQVERIVSVKTKYPYFADKSKLKVFRTESGRGTEMFEDDEAKEVINAYLPRKIKEYFFFDGEQLYNYFGRQDTNLNVKSSIHGVAQISVVTATKEHLSKIIKDLRFEIGKINPDVQRFADEIAAKESRKEELETDNLTLDGQVSKAEAELKVLAGKISGSEHAVEERKHYENNIKSLDEIEATERDCDKALVSLVRKYYTPLMMYEINKSTSAYIQDKKSKGKLPPDIDIDLIRKSLLTHKCAVCGEDVTENSEVHLKEILDKLEISTSASNHLMEIKNDVLRLGEMVESYKSDKQSIYDSLKAVREKKKALEAENKEIQGNLLDEKSTEQIGTWMFDEENLRNLQKKNIERIGANKSMIEKLGEEIEELNKKLDKARKENEKCEELNVQLTFATDAYSIVRDIEKEIISEIRGQMETETMDIFSELIWKKDTYGRISLNDNYKLELYSKYSDISCLGSCSAAETQLLALAFTIALHRVSGHDAPLFIDTPVGRVSDQNRENFAKTLVEISRGKQIIMSFTPSEFSEEISKYFANTVLSSKRKLQLAGEQTISEVQ